MNVWVDWCVCFFLYFTENGELRCHLFCDSCWFSLVITVMSDGGSPYRKHRKDLESGGGGSNGGYDDYESGYDPFDIARTKSAPADRLRRWRVLFSCFVIVYLMFWFNIDGCCFSFTCSCGFQLGLTHWRR